MKAYLDNMATTPVDPEVAEQLKVLTDGVIGNPHATMHGPGRDAAAVVSKARAEAARAVSIRPEEIVFTPSATIADNLAVIGVARARARRGKHLVVSAIEHPAVLMAAKYLRENEGFELEVVPVGGDGIVDPAAVAAVVRPETSLVSIMAVNNELGTIQPIREIAKTLENSRAFFHTDASQAPGRVSMDFVSHVDLMTLSSHKIYGPRGAGVLFVRRRRDINIEPLFFGGGQENGLCPGTINTAAVCGMGLAVGLAAKEQQSDCERLAVLGKRLYEGISEALPGSVLIGDRTRAVPHCQSIMIAGIPGETFVSRLARVGVAVSLGSACHGAPALPSHVLSAVGLNPAEARRTIRFGLGRFTAAEEIEYTLEQVRALADETSV